MTDINTVCPDCHGGKGFTGIACGASGSNIVWRDCILCNGSGQVSMATRRRFNEGRKARADRIRRGETLAAAAKRLGISPAALCRQERGMS